ncbi:DNA/RNA non-specific endonuclease [Streptomyces sp. NPDC050287]|uniref:DNA/RNA non-specific endonuclease n=1 Tax=Streptomyces sp. NPDC050287 TaxID=3365608 RepID=UPI0037ABE743
MTIKHAIRPERPGRIRVRSAVLTLLTVVTLGLTTPGVSYAQQGAEAKPRHVGRIDSADLPATAPLTRTSAFPADSGEHCEPTRARSKERRAGAAEACVSTSPAPVKRTATQQRSLAAAADSGSCDITTPGSYSYKRFEYCVTGVNVVYILRDSNAKEIGRGTLTVSTSATLPSSGTTWNEQVTVRMTAASGAVTALNAKFRASCGTGCTTTKAAPWYGGDLTVGQSISGTVAYSSTPAPDTDAEFTTSYKLYVTSPGATAVDPNASWDNPRKIRCDDAVRDVTATGTPSPGCVIPTVMAVVPMSAQGSDAGAAVAAYQWAQQNLADGWGQNKPLTRAKSGTADRTARTCGGAGSEPFQNLTELVPDDSCGEFPFAQTREGGADGAQCAEVIPNFGNGGWDTYLLGNSLDLDPAAPCVRAHVPQADKQFADGKLSEGFQNQRVIDAEQFKVEFSTPTAGPQAPCLGNLPTGSLPSGDGWIKNTTEPVAHVNKTTTPLGPPGTRPTTAQACLGKKLGKGSGAKGDITGWQDAQLFAQANPPVVAQARCHLIANILGGKGQIQDGGQNNLVPCWQVGMNTGTPSMRTYEAQAQNMVADQSFGANDAILYQVTPVYRDATSTIPVGVTMSANIERADGTTELLFPNVYVTNTQANTGQLNLGN